jgi:flagellar motor switch protein FliN/FliY
MKVKAVDFVELDTAAAAGKPLVNPSLAMLKHVNVNLEVRLGEASLTVADLFALRSGSLLELDRHVDEPVDVLLNGKLVACGQLAVMGDHLGVRITEILNTETALTA